MPAHPGVRQGIWSLARLGYGAFNFHPGPPSYPGWVPSHFALYERLTEFGATVHVMVEQVEQVPFELWYLRVIPILPIGLTTRSVRCTSTSCLRGFRVRAVHSTTQIICDMTATVKRRDFRFGSIATEIGCPRYVRSSPDSDHITDAPTCRKSATCGRATFGLATGEPPPWGFALAHFGNTLVLASAGRRYLREKDPGRDSLLAAPKRSKPSPT